MKKKLMTVAILLLALPLLAGGTRAAPCTTTMSAGGDIQAAIDAANPGDVICLEAGLYTPSAKIHIDKSVTLQGPGAGVDPRPSAATTRVPGDASTEAVIDGSVNGLSGIIVIEADNVVLDGLDITGGSGDMIDSESATPTIGTVLRYNIIHDSASPGDEGIQIRNCTDGVIEFNYIFNIAQDGINMCCGSSGGMIRFNEVYDNYSENAAIYVYESTDMTIECNLVYDVFGNDGIKVGAKNGGDASESGGTVLGNVVHDTAQDGISVYMSDTVVDSNEVYNSSSENGAIYLAWAISEISVTNNYVHDNNLDSGKWGDPAAIMIGTAVNAATVYVNNNNIVNNSVNGVTNKATALLDAEENWWGADDGPSGAGTGSGDAVSTNVDFDPWLAESQVIVDPCVLNQPPDCSGAYPSIGTLWPPNHKFHQIEVLGVTDPDGDPVTITVDSIYQDEEVDSTGDGAFAPDGDGVGTSTALIRAERDGSNNGRVYHIGYTADDGQGGTCSGEIVVSVPKSMGKKGAAVDDGVLYDSTAIP